MRSPRLTRQHTLFAAMSVIWGVTWIAMKLGVAVVPPLLFAGTRFVIAGTLLLTWQARGGGPLRHVWRHPARFALVTSMMIVATYALLFWGVQHVPTGLAAVINNALMPVALLAMGVVSGEERFTVRQAAAIALGLGGLAVLFGPSAMNGAVADPLQVWGIAATVCATLAYSLGSVLARPLLRSASPTAMSGSMNLTGGIALVVLSLALEPGAARALHGDWGLAAWGGWLFLVLFGSLGGYTIYLLLIRDWGAARAGLYAFVSPVIAVLSGVAVFGETLHATDAIGMVIMLAAAWLALRRPAENAVTTGSAGDPTLPPASSRPAVPRHPSAR